MASEVFQLGILLSLKDAASGGLDAFARKAHVATQNLEKDLHALDKTTKTQTNAIAKEIGKKISSVEKLGGNLSKIDTLKNGGLTSAAKNSAAVLTQIKQEADALKDLQVAYKNKGNTKASNQAGVLATDLTGEAKRIEQIGAKIKTIQKLREQDTESGRQQAKVLEQEVKSEVQTLDRLATKLREVKSLKSDNLEIKIKSDNLGQQVKEIENLENHYEKLRQGLNRDLAIGGIGVTGLAALYKGAKAAGDFQAVMTDLQATLATSKGGGVDVNALGADMQKAEVIAVKLGNALPGTTADFVEMMQVLKQNGLETETIMNGAAEAVAHLAVANNAIPKDIASDFAQYGNLFKLKPEEFQPAADVFSRIFTSTGQTSAELVEAAKYFEGRAGTSLGISGLKDAEQITRLFGLMGKSGLRGSSAGTSLTDFFSEYNRHADDIKDLQKTTGIKLDFFDAKGKFAGMDTVFEQMKQFDKLSEKDRGNWLEKVFGLRGMSAANIFLAEGLEGWKKFNAEQEKTVGVEDKVSMKAATFNNQMEALSGTLENLKVTVFEPMLPGLTSATGSLNTLVGSIQEFAKAHPDTSKFIIELAAYGTTAMVVYSGFKTLTTGIKLFRLASAFSSGGGLLNYLNQTTVAANAAGTSISTATTRARGLRGALQSQTATIAVQIGAIMGIEYLIGVIQGEIQKAFDAGEAKKNAIDTTNKSYSTFQQAEKEGTKFSQKDFAGQAQTTWASVMGSGLKDTIRSEVLKKPVVAYSRDNMLSQAATETFLYPITKWAGAENKFENGFGGTHDKNSLAQGFIKTAPELADPRIMTEFLRQLDTRVPNKAEQTPIKEGLAQAFPDSFTKAIQELSALNFAPLTQSFAELSTQMGAQAQAQTQNNELFNQQGIVLQTFGQNLNNLQSPVTQTQQNLLNLGTTANQVPPPLTRIAGSANNAAGSLDNLSEQFANYQIPTPQVQTFQIGIPQAATAPGLSGLSIPAHAVGGVVERDGVAMIHAGNIITPARTKGFGAVNSLIQSAVANNSANSATSKSFAANNFDGRQTGSSLLNNFNADFSPAEPSSTGAVSGNQTSPLGRQAELAKSILSQSAANNQVSVNYSPQITVNGASPAAQKDFQAMLNDHAKHISRLVADNMENRRYRE